MGLDFTVSEIIEHSIDKQGRTVFTTTELADFGHAGYKMMDYGLGNQDNCTTVSYNSSEFLECLNSMKKVLEEINKTGIDKYNEKSDLVNAIDELQWFIEEEHITEDTDRVFDIHIWY